MWKNFTKHHAIPGFFRKDKRHTLGSILRVSGNDSSAGWSHKPMLHPNKTISWQAGDATPALRKHFYWFYSTVENSCMETSCSRNAPGWLSGQPSWVMRGGVSAEELEGKEGWGWGFRLWPQYMGKFKGWNSDGWTTRNPCQSQRTRRTFGA